MSPKSTVVPGSEPLSFFFRADNTTFLRRNLNTSYHSLLCCQMSYSHNSSCILIFLTPLTSLIPQTLFFLFCTMTNNAQLFHKLSHFSCMFRHYYVILRAFVVSALLSYTSLSNAVVGDIF